jgi:hypothetical protein
MVDRIATTEFVVECLWPDVHADDLRALDERAAAESERLTEGGRPVEYLGSLLMPEDEVVLCLFRGSREGVGGVVQAAGIPCDRILEAARSPWTTQSSRRTG